MRLDCRLFGNQHGIDGKDHAVAGGRVHLDDFGPLYRHVAILHLDINFRAIDGLDLAGHGMLCQDAGWLGLVLRFEEVFERAFWKLGEGRIGGGEDGEGPGVLEGRDQVSGLEGSDECRAFAGFGSNGHNVLGFSGRGTGAAWSTRVA